MKEQDFNKIIESLNEDALLTVDEKQRLKDRYEIGTAAPTNATPEQLKNTAEYSKRIYALNDNSAEARGNRLLAKSRGINNFHTNDTIEMATDLPYDVVKEVFKNILSASCARKNKIFQIGNHSAIYRNLTLYAMRSPECTWDLKKGLLIFGNFGSGKTNALECLSQLEKMLYENNRYAGFTVRTSEEIMSSMFNNKKGGFQDFDNEHLMIDDIGFNDGKKKIYGTEIDFKEFLSIRHRLFINHKLKTHATSNIDMLNNRKVLELFEGRLESRFNEMFNFINMEGVDYRKV